MSRAGEQKNGAAAHRAAESKSRADQIRKRALKRLQAGDDVEEVAEDMRISVRNVIRWRKEMEQQAIEDRRAKWERIEEDLYRITLDTIETTRVMLQQLREAASEETGQHKHHLAMACGVLIDNIATLVNGAHYLAPEEGEDDRDDEEDDEE